MTRGQLIDTLTALVWPADSQIARGLICAIAVLLSCALLFTIGHLVRLLREARALRRVAARLRTWRVGGSYPQLSLVDLRSRLGELEVAAGRRSHVARLVETIHKLRSHRVKINLATLQQLVEHDESTRLGVGAPHHVANFAIMIGILGTFWGLGHMVRAIGVALPETAGHVSVETWTRSIGQVRTVLEGMRTAFSTSLVGMATAIVSGLCGVLLASLQQRLLKSIEAFAVSDLLPATVPTLEDDSILEHVSGQLEKAFAQLDGIADKNLTSIQEFTAAQTTLRTLVEDIRSIAHSEASRDLERVLASVVGGNEAVLELLRRMPPAIDTKREIEQVRTMLEGTERALRKLGDALPRRFDIAARAEPLGSPPPPEHVAPADALAGVRRSASFHRRASRTLVAGLVVLGVGVGVGVMLLITLG